MTLTGTPFSDALYGTSSSDFIDGGDGNDYIFGDAGGDIILGGNGNDYIDGGTGNDWMLGGNGNDTYKVDSLGDTITEHANGGIDTVLSSVSYTLSNNLENLQLSGSADLSGTGNGLDNMLYGNQGDNLLNGKAGNDTLVGYAGGNEWDTLTGGSGDDLFVLGDSQGTFYMGAGWAVITDFYWADDKIQLTGSLSDYHLEYTSFGGVGTSDQDTIIWKGNDIIGIVQDNTNVLLNYDFNTVAYSPFG